MLREERLANLLAAAGKAHHDAFAAVDGDDPDWPRWYSFHLRDDVSMVLGVELTLEELAELLEHLAAQHQEQAPERPWHEYYAEVVASKYRAGS